MSKTLLRDILLVTALKFAALAALYLLFFSPAQRHFDDIAIHIAGQKVALITQESR
ncbi:MAG: hypothetical protein K6U10_09185 [Acidobacteriia bacterium]|nr:hypothetical protein [Methyloceanibacter sp.]MBX5471750.1 hypothetical protein [Acetobacteraceae bacterium]MCL6491978.1 hypothetical protein [Terriglobia bacterium]